MNKDTKYIHSLYKSAKACNDLVEPIHMSSTYKHESAENLSNIFSGKGSGYVYSRVGNPSVSSLEEKMAILEGGEEAAATSSGMSAISMTILGLLDYWMNNFHTNVEEKPLNIVVSGVVYGGTYNLFNKYISSMKIKPIFIKPTEDPEKLNIDNGTIAIFIETPTNPTLETINIKKWSDVAKRNNIPLIVDNTFLTSYYQNPIKLGADLVVHSTAKYLNGHGDCIGGVVIGNSKYIKHIKLAIVYYGACMSPFNAWLILRGLKTLPLRMERHIENAMYVRNILWYDKADSGYFSVKNVKCASGMVVFELSDFPAKDTETCHKFLNNLKLCKIAVSLGGCETIAQHPASMTHSTYTKKERKKFGITDGLIRMSIGLEDKLDIAYDIRQALRRLICPT